MIKNFSIFKNKPSENEKAPTHSISFKYGDEYITGGACWTKEGKGGKYLSCKLQDAYVDHTDRTKTRKGFAIADEAVVAKEILGENTPVEGDSKPQNDDLDAF